MSYKKRKCRVSAPKQNDKFELNVDSYYVSDIKDYF